MYKDLIIGAGFSAAITSIFLKKKIKIIGTCNHDIIKNYKFLRRKELEVNKLLSKKTYSYGTLKYKIKDRTLHDRLILGGNTKIWGGHISINKIPKFIIKILSKNNIIFKKLSFKETGTESNNQNIVQLQSINNQILDTNNIPLKIKNGYLEKIIYEKKKLFVNILTSENKIKKIEVGKLFLCIGAVQLIDVLYRSKMIKNNDVIEFSEFKHNFKIGKKNFNSKSKSTLIKYHFSRAIGHLLGIQKYSTFLKLFSFIPIYVDQSFYSKRLKFKFLIKKGCLYEISKRNLLNKNFGNSIHYCNFKINNINVRKYLQKINPNIHGFGMSFVDQTEPGPISNDIVNDIYKELGILKLLKK